ncbi:hypothetical protein CRYUN_Cryun40dG0001200 [Craigia yunnanensis]
MAKDDCDELLQYAIDELQASFSMVGDSELHNMQEREAEIKNWLNAVISFQESCVDQVPQPQLQRQLSDGFLNASQLTSNALAIVNSISQILTAFNLNSLNFGGESNRKLMDESNSADKKYPPWVSSSDRKLLGSRNNAQLTPNAIVAKDGSGQYKTIGDALKAYPKNLQGRYVIYVKAGIYDEYIIVDKKQVNVFMYGDGPWKTMVTGRKSNRDGYTTTDTASFSAIGDGFIAKAMGFQNTAGWMGTKTPSMFKPIDNSTGIASYLAMEGIFKDCYHGINIGDLIQPAGWLEWEGNFALDTLYYAEYANRGPGTDVVGWLSCTVLPSPPAVNCKDWLNSLVMSGITAELEGILHLRTGLVLNPRGNYERGDKALVLGSAIAASPSAFDFGMPTRDDLSLILSLRAKKASLSRASLALFFVKVASLTLRSASTLATAAALVMEAAAILAAARSALAASLSITLFFWL